MIKFGIIGCGVIGGIHAQVIAGLEGEAKLIGVCDYSVERAEAFAKEYGVTAYNSYEEMLADPEIDAVAVCTPSGLHKDQAVKALLAGKHVLLEKPMALNAADAKEIIEAEKKSSKLLSVVSQLRCSPDIRELRETINSGCLGQIVFVDLYMKYWRDPSYYSESGWRGTFAMDGGGALMNQGIHGIDTVNLLMGKPRVVASKVKTLYHKIETEDTAAAIVEYPCGALGVIEGSTAANPGFERKIVINGTRGYAVLKDMFTEKLYIDGKAVIDREIAENAGNFAQPSLIGTESHTRQYKNFIAALEKGEKLFSTAEDGLAAVALIEEIYEYSKNNK